MARIGVHKDVNRVAQEIKKLGYQLRFDGNDHLQIIRPTGEVLRHENGAPVTMPNSPGSREGIHSLRAKLKKAGIPLTEGGKVSAARSPEKAARQDILRERFRAYLGDERRGDRRAFVILAIETAQEHGISVPYGRAKKTAGPGVTLEESAERSFGSFVNGVTGFNSTVEAFWMKVMDILEQPIETAQVIPLGSFEGDVALPGPLSGKTGSEAPYREAGEKLVTGQQDATTQELIGRVLLLAALADPEHHIQTLRQSQMLVAFILEGK